MFAAKNGAIVGPLKGSDGYVITQGRGLARGPHPVRDGASLELAEEKLRAGAGRRARQGRRRGGAGARPRQNPTAALKTIFPPPSDTQEASARRRRRRAARRGDRAVRAARDAAKARSSRASASRTPSPRPPSRSRRTQPLAGPFAVGDNFFVVRLKERKEPDLAEFEKRKLELAREAELAKGERVLSDWTHAACVEAKEAKRISVNTGRAQVRRRAATSRSATSPAPAQPPPLRRLAGDGRRGSGDGPRPRGRPRAAHDRKPRSGRGGRRARVGGLAGRRHPARAETGQPNGLRRRRGRLRAANLLVDGKRLQTLARGDRAARRR